MSTRFSDLIKLPVQVASVCYNMNRADIEFLLVNTKTGKWTFPKGSALSGVPLSQTAAQEALEEAGVLGTIERDPVYTYIHAKGVFWKKPAIREFAVKAFLMEVERRRAPREFMRNPTWFPIAATHRMLAQGREITYRNEMKHLIDLAEATIRQRRTQLSRQALRK